MSSQRLHGAVYRGNINLVRNLLNQGVNVNARTNGRTPLITAARFGRTNIARLLIRAGANVNAKDEEYMTALMWALNRGHRNVSKILIHSGANVRAAVHYVHNNATRNILARAMGQRRTAKKLTQAAEQRFRRRKATSLLMSPRLLGSGSIRPRLPPEVIGSIGRFLSVRKR